MKTRTAEVETEGHRHIIVVRGELDYTKFKITIRARLRNTSPCIPLSTVQIIVDALYENLK